MLFILWEYQLKPDKRAEFESMYSPKGTWATLFHKGAGYLGTELLRDETNPYRYLTIDHWNSREDYEGFLSRWHKEYNELDTQCEGLTESESCIGKFHGVNDRLSL